MRWRRGGPLNIWLVQSGPVISIHVRARTGFWQFSEMYSEMCIDKAVPKMYRNSEV